METLEFIVNLPKWKSIYRSTYKSDTGVVKFASLVNGTIHLKVPEFTEQDLKKMADEVIAETGDELKDFAKKLGKLIAKKTKDKELQKWLAAEVLTRSGLNLVADKRGLKKLLKEI